MGRNPVTGRERLEELVHDALDLAREQADDLRIIAAQFTATIASENWLIFGGQVYRVLDGNRGEADLPNPEPGQWYEYWQVNVEEE